MGEHRHGMLAICAATMLAAALPMTTSAHREPGERRPGTNPKLVPVDRQRRRNSNSGSLSKLLASGRRRGRI